MHDNERSFIFGLVMDKQTKIFTAAEALLAERGIAGLSMKLLAERADIAAFDTNRPMYEKLVEEYSMTLVMRRRQRVMELNIKLRKSRLL